jgi:hyperosmotically inducible protein
MAAHKGGFQVPSMLTFKHALFGMGAAVAILGLAGCASNKDESRSEGRVVDDRKITAQVQEQLANEPVYKYRDVDAKTFAGVVQLSGFVATEDQKARAAAVAQSVPGVIQVVNSLTVVPQMGPTPTGRTNDLRFSADTNSPAYPATPPVVTDESNVILNR